MKIIAFDLGDVGYRKPAPTTLRRLAETLLRAPSNMTYVENEKKDVEAALVATSDDHCGFPRYEEGAPPASFKFVT